MSTARARGTKNRAHLFKPGQSGNPRGKPKGVKNRKTLFKEALAKQGIDLKKLTPLEYLLLEMRNGKNPKRVRIHCADSTLPYQHRRLPSEVEVAPKGEFAEFMNAIASAARKARLPENKK